MKSKKIILGICIILCMAYIIHASINLYFGRIDTELKVEQAITIDGNPSSDPIKDKLKVLSGASVEVEHDIINKGDIDANITHYSIELIEGIELMISWENGTEVIFPFVSYGGEKVTLIFRYSTDLNLIEDTYMIQTYFVCEKI